MARTWNKTIEPFKKLKLKKITELTEIRWRIVPSRDDYGNFEETKENYVAYRRVNVVSSGLKFAHFLVDYICFQIVINIVSYFFQIILNFTDFNATINLTLALYTSIILLLLYPGLYAFSEFMWQRTPAKFLTKSIVIDEYGNKPELRAIILRSFIRLVPFEPFSSLGETSSGWHDRWSKTWVVSEEELAEIKRLQEEQSKLTE